MSGDGLKHGIDGRKKGGRKICQEQRGSSVSYCLKVVIESVREEEMNL